MKILVLDIDQVHNKKVETTLSPKGSTTKTFFFRDRNSLLEVINANPAMELKKKELEKIVAETEAMINSTATAIANLKQKLTESAELKESPPNPATNQPGASTSTSTNSATLQTQISQGSELNAKLESSLIIKKKDLENLAGNKEQEEKKVSLVLIDRSFLGNNPTEWVTEFRNQIAFADNKNVPLMTMGYNENLDYIKNTLVGGIDDYLVKPVDALLLKYRAARMSGQKLDSNDKIYELQAKSELKLLRIAQITKMSEFEVETQTDSQFNVNELIEFFADAFSEDKGGRILARCQSCEKDANQKGIFVSNFSFVGLTPHLMNEMRKWLKLQYIASKEKK